MKWITGDFRHLNALFVNQLRVMLSAEEQMVRELPNMAVRATDEQLQQAFRKHVLETEEHIRRLEQILADEKRKNPAADATGPVKCKAMASLGTEAEEMIMDAADAWVRDVALIAAAQRVEHYEMAAYGALRQWARLLGEHEMAELLDQTLKEEGHADHLLSEIAERVNPKAKKAA
jgi:ferritin-like metal-binding protein YciE